MHATSAAGTSSSGAVSVAPAVGSSILGFMSARTPRQRGASRAGHIALHVLAAVVLYLALCTVLWLGLQVSPAWGTAGFVAWVGLVAGWIWWSGRRKRR